MLLMIISFIIVVISFAIFILIHKEIGLELWEAIVVLIIGATVIVVGILLSKYVFSKMVFDELDKERRIRDEK